MRPFRGTVCIQESHIWGLQTSPMIEASCGSAGLPSDALVGALPKSFPLPSDFQLRASGCTGGLQQVGISAGDAQRLTQKGDRNRRPAPAPQPSLSAARWWEDSRWTCLPGPSDPENMFFFNTWRTFRSKRWLRPTSTGIPHRTAGLERTSSCSSYTMPFQGQRFP